MARPTVIITVEGVIQKMVTTAPIPAGVGLYRSLGQTHNIVLISEYAKKPELENWLVTENLQSHSKVVYNDDPELKGMSAWSRRIRQVNKIARTGHDIHFVIDPDPAVAKELIEGGHDTLLCSYHSYAYPEWLPDAELTVRPWDEMVAAVNLRSRTRALDERLKEINELD